jgi:dTDP-4-amino-4,6-dideoxygalactose transaminase
MLTPSFEAREMIRLALQEEDIESRPLWKPMHLQPVFSGEACYTDGTAEDLFARGLCLPSGSNLLEEDLSRIVNLILNTLS